MKFVPKNKNITLAQLRDKRQKIAETFGTRSKEYSKLNLQIFRRLAKGKETKQIKPGSNLGKGIAYQKQRKIARETAEKKISLKQGRVRRERIAKVKGSQSKEYKAVSRIISRRLKRGKETKQSKPGSNLGKGVLAQKHKKEQRIKREKGILIPVKIKVKKVDYGKKMKTLFAKYKGQFVKDYGTTDIGKVLEQQQEQEPNLKLKTFFKRLFDKYGKKEKRKRKRREMSIRDLLGEGREKPKYCPTCGELLGTNPDCEVCENNQPQEYES